MPSVYDPDNFKGRVNYAAQVIARGGTQTRHFDTCFEMYDGVTVANAVYRRSFTNQRLATNLPRYLNMEILRDEHEDLKHIPTRGLAAVAAETRKARQKAFEEREKRR